MPLYWYCWFYTISLFFSASPESRQLGKLIKILPLSLNPEIFIGHLQSNLHVQPPLSALICEPLPISNHLSKTPKLPSQIPIAEPS